MADCANTNRMEPDRAEPSTPRTLRNQINHFPFWAPRFWHGMRLGPWMRFLSANRFRVHPLRLPMAAVVSGVACFNSAMSLAQQLAYGRAIANTRIDQPPVFVLGHWRSGTTFLHELLVLDARFGYPTTYECFAANHFLVTGRILPSLVSFLLPSKRPMDDMPVSFNHPQEDEFALVSMGAPTPILKMAFPNDPPPYMELLDMAGVADDVLNSWRDSLMQFIQALTYVKQKPLVLKSPPHTGRIGVLAEMFPGARFIHIVRNPFSMFPSTRRLWVALEEAQAFQIPHHRQLDDYIFQAFERMYAGFESQRRQIAPNRLCEVRYEDLVSQPLEQLRRIYTSLELGDFEESQPQVQQYLEQCQGYRVNRHELEPEVEQQIRRRWAFFIDRYRY